MNGKSPGFIMVELLVFSILLAVVLGGVIDVVGCATRSARVLREKRSDALAYASLMSRIRAGAARENFDDGKRRLWISGGDLPLSPRNVRVEAAAFGVAGDISLSWTRRDIRCME
jgi:type II secretory pathway pseudopilin PulG